MRARVAKENGSTHQRFRFPVDRWDWAPMRNGADSGLSTVWGNALCASRESNEMRPLRYSINVTLDGCCHHEAGIAPDEESMRYWTAQLERADALLFGRVTYEMMEAAWRPPELV